LLNFSFFYLHKNLAMSDDLKLMAKAIKFAAQKHRNQRRKDTDATPYINHPIDLADLLLNEAHVEDITVIVAAILHDTLEDTDTSSDEINQIFGIDVENIVVEVTDDKKLPKMERKRLQIEHTKTCSQQAKLVKLADKICNLRDMIDHPPMDWSLERKREYFDWAKEVIDQLRGVDPGLELMFDEAYARKPVKT